MPVVVACTSCHAKLSANENILGKAVKCPKCGTVFTAAVGQNPTPISAAPPPPVPPPSSSYDDDDRPRRRSRSRDDDDDDDDRPSRRRSRDDDDYDDDRPRSRGSWQTTTTGLRLIQVSIICFIVISALLNLIQIINPLWMMPGGGFGGRPGQFGAPPPAGAFVMVGGCLAIVIAIVAFVGMCMCCGAPYPPAHKRALTSVFLVVGTIVAFVIGIVLVIALAANVGGRQFNPQMGANGFLAMGVTGIFILLVLVGLIVATVVFWMLFHAAVGDACRDASVRSLAIITMAIFLIMIPVSIGITALTGMIFNDFITLHRVNSVWSLISSLGLYITYLILCSKTLRAIERR